MKKFIFFIVLLFLNSLAAQEKTNQNLRMGFYSNTEANVGFDLGSILRDDSNKTEYEKQQEDPGRYNYGVSSLIGYQPIKWFALGGGLRYSYIDPNFHLIYAFIQPQFIINNVQQDDPVFIKLNFGKQINSSVVKNTGFVGLSFGKSEVINPHFAHYFQFNLDAQALDSTVFFVGFSYGIQIFSNKNFNTY